MIKSSSTISKVPQITLYFWLIKLLSTAMGEATSDFLVYHSNPYVAVLLGLLGFVITFILQIKAKRYIAWIYWLFIVMIAIFGTMVADVTHVVLGVPYLWSSLTYAILLTSVFIIWFRVEKTLSIHSINTRRRELFYFAAVVATFAMGTALGDMSAMTLHLGYLASGLLFILLFLLPAIGFKSFRWNPIFSFWFAYIITRPLGASFADWFSKPATITGLGYGDGIVAILLTILIVVLVAYLSLTKIDDTNETTTR